MEVRAQRERVNLLNQAKNQATFDAVMGHCNRDRFQEPNAVQYCPFTLVATVVTPNWEIGNFPTALGSSVNTARGDVGTRVNQPEYMEYTVARFGPSTQIRTNSGDAARSMPMPLPQTKASNRAWERVTSRSPPLAASATDASSSSSSSRPTKGSPGHRSPLSVHARL